MAEFDIADLDYDDGPGPIAVGFLTRDEEIRVAAATIAATSQATGEYKPTAATIITIAKAVEDYIRYGK